MTGVDLGYVRAHPVMLLTLAAIFLVLFQAVKRNTKDRVLLSQTIAFASFIVAMVVFRLGDLSGPMTFLVLVPFIAFTIMAGYFGLDNWLRRKRKID